MRPTQARLSGIVPPLCTPLTDAGGVDVRSLERLVARQLDAGVHGVFVLGSSGEAIYLDDESRVRTLRAAVSTVAGAVPVLAGAVAGSTARVIQQIRWIERFAVDAVVVTAPFYAVVSDAEVAAHFEAIAAATDLPILAYDIPGNVGRKLPEGVVVDLLRRSVIAGLKDSSGDMDAFVRTLGDVGPDRTASLLSGSDTAAAVALAAGADGIVPGIGNVWPEVFVELHAAHRAGDLETVDRLQARIKRLGAVLGVGVRHGLGRHASELGALKFLLHRAGTIRTPRVSVPLASLPPDACAEVLSIAEVSNG